MTVKRGDRFFKNPRVIFSLLLILLFISCSSEYLVIRQNSELLSKFHGVHLYRIGCGDILDVLVWGHDKFSAHAVVRPDGRISLPVVGDVVAEGLMVDELKRRLNAKVSQYLKSTDVSVIVCEIRSRKYYVTGEVTRPGQFSLDSRTDVLQAIARAGGFTVYARADRIQIIRHEGNERMKIEFSFKEVLSGKNLDQNIPLRPGDVIVVP